MMNKDGLIDIKQICDKFYKPTKNGSRSKRSVTLESKFPSESPTIDETIVFLASMNTQSENVMDIKLSIIKELLILKSSQVTPIEEVAVEIVKEKKVAKEIPIDFDTFRGIDGTVLLVRGTKPTPMEKLAFEKVKEKGRKLGLIFNDDKMYARGMVKYRMDRALDPFGNTQSLAKAPTDRRTLLSFVIYHTVKGFDGLTGVTYENMGEIIEDRIYKHYNDNPPKGFVDDLEGIGKFYSEFMDEYREIREEMKAYRYKELGYKQATELELKTIKQLEIDKKEEEYYKKDFDMHLIMIQGAVNTQYVSLRKYMVRDDAIVECLKTVPKIFKDHIVFQNV